MWRTTVLSKRDPAHAREEFVLETILLAAGANIGKTVLIVGRSSGIERMSTELFGGERMDVVATSQSRRRIFKNRRIYGVFYSGERMLAILSALGDAR